MVNLKYRKVYKPVKSMSSKIFQFGYKTLVWAGITLLAALTILTAPHRVEASDNQTIPEVVQRAIDDGEPDRLRILSDQNISLGDVLVAEHLPQRGASSNEYLVEFEGQWREMTFRYPIVVKQDGDDTESWRVTWAPRAIFARALIKMLKDGLPRMKLNNSRTWSLEARTPALPVVITDQGIVTPFGPVHSEGSGTQRRPLPRHAQRWINGAMNGDGAAASVDFLVTPSASWKRIHTAIYQVASHGMYRLNFIGVTGEASKNNRTVVSMPVLAPVRLGSGDGDRPLPKLRLGFQHLTERGHSTDDATRRFAVTLRGMPMDLPTPPSSETSEPCPNDADACVDGVQHVGKLMKQLSKDSEFSDQKPRLGIAAFSGNTTAQTVVDLLTETARELGIRTSQWMLTRFGNDESRSSNQDSSPSEEAQ